MSEIRTFLRQSSYYFVGQIIIMAAGFVSFPILTRIFSVSEYGILGLITTTVLIAIAISKFGFPSSIVRFYAEFESKKQLDSFYSTMFLGSVGLAATLSIVFWSLAKLMGDGFIDKNIINLVPLVSILIFCGSTLDTLNTFFRAQQRAKLYSLVTIIRRYGSLGLGILSVFYLSKGLFSFVLGQVTSGVAIFLFFVYIIFRKRGLNFEIFSSEIFRDSIKFGFPLIWAELGYLVLHYSDRYLIQLYLGPASLGFYTAGYNLATYITEMIMYPVNYAISPIYMSILVNKGEEKTKEFFTKSFRYFLLVNFGIVFGFIAVGKDLISFLATIKYLEAYSILPYIVVGQSVYACSIILNNGLFIKKKMYIITYVMLVTGALSIGTNIILIPKFGIVGAGWTNLITNIFYTLVITYYAFREFSFRIDYAHIILYLVSSLVMFVALRYIHFEGQLVNLIGRIAIGAMIYSTLILLFDKEIRNKLSIFVKDLKKR